MIKFVLGPSGSGKTRWLIDEANKDKRERQGNIVFIDTDNSHIFTLDHKVRLINAADFHIDCINKLYGFLAGFISWDYDIEKIYIDGIYEIIDFKDEDTIKKLSDMVEVLSKEFEVNFYIGLNKKATELPAELKENAVEVHYQD